MSYLIRTKHKKEKDPLKKFVGAYIPLRLFTSLVIYSLANVTNKSATMEQIFSEWLKVKFTPDIEKECYHVIAAKMHIRYEELLITKRSLTYSMFIDDLKKDFEFKGLYYSIIQNILKELDAIHFNR